MAYIVPMSTYETTYANDRRKHRHRCQCCGKIINVGDRVVMWRLGRITRAVHIECQDTIAIDNVTYRQLAELHIKDMRK
jgi:hypothetical protein